MENTIREYGRTELAQLYFPMLCADAAWRKLKKWINLNTILKAKLRQVNYQEGTGRSLRAWWHVLLRSWGIRDLCAFIGWFLQKRWFLMQKRAKRGNFDVIFSVLGGFHEIRCSTGVKYKTLIVSVLYIKKSQTSQFTNLPISLFRFWEKGRGKNIFIYIL